MEKKKLTLRSLPFFTGVISGGLLFGLFLLISGSKPPDPQPPFTTINTTIAKSYFQRYRHSPSRLQYPLPNHAVDTLKGIAIDLDQLKAMNSLLNHNLTLQGFRIYSGLDEAFNRIGIVVGIDIMGHDDTTNIIQTSRIYEPCPPICDANSHIIKN